MEMVHRANLGQFGQLLSFIKYGHLLLHVLLVPIDDNNVFCSEGTATHMAVLGRGFLEGTLGEHTTAEAQVDKPAVKPGL